MSKITREDLCFRVLGWYSDPAFWLPKSSRPISQVASAVSPAIEDRGKMARRALAAKHTGDILLVLCDAYDVSLTTLGRKADITDSRIAEIAQGSELSGSESAAIYAALDNITGVSYRSL